MSNGCATYKRVKLVVAADSTEWSGRADRATKHEQHLQNQRIIRALAPHRRILQQLQLKTEESVGKVQSVLFDGVVREEIFVRSVVLPDSTLCVFL